MTNEASVIFGKLFQNGSNALKMLKETAVSPDSQKVLREWGITDVADMVGRSSQTIRNLEEKGKIPEARLVQNGKRKERVYNLSEINELRNYFGTRPHKPVNCTPARLGFVNFKGGAGKTTTAVCSAQYFAKLGYKVLLLDCDSQGSATQMFGYIPDEDFEEEDTLLGILTGETDNIRELIKKTYWDGLDIIPANLSLYNAELIIPIQITENPKIQFYNRLNEALDLVQDDYDIIILDCPPSLGMISMNAIYCSNALMIEMPPVIVDFASTIQFFKMVHEVMERLPQKSYSFIRILITKFNGRTAAKELQDFLRHSFGQYLLQNTMIESEAISKASASLQTIYEVDKYDSDRKTYERAIESANRVNEEIESLVKIMWKKSQQSNCASIESQVKDVMHV